MPVARFVNIYWMKLSVTHRLNCTEEIDLQSVCSVIHWKCSNRFYSIMSAKSNGKMKKKKENFCVICVKWIKSMAWCRLFYCLKSVESIEKQLTITIATAFSNQFHMVRSFRDAIAMSIIQLAIFQFSNCWLQYAVHCLYVQCACQMQINNLTVRFYSIHWSTTNYQWNCQQMLNHANQCLFNDQCTPSIYRIQFSFF